MIQFWAMPLLLMFHRECCQFLLFSRYTKHFVLTGHQALRTHKLWEFYLQAESQAIGLCPMFWKSLGSWTKDTGHDAGEILVSQWPQSCAFPLHRSACKLLGSFPRVIWNWGRDFKTEAGRSRLAGGSFNKQRRLTCEACLARQQEWGSPHFPTKP